MMRNSSRSSRGRMTIAMANPTKRASCVAPQIDMKTATTRLIEFLQFSEYPNALSSRILQCPTSKDVYGIFEHLFRQIDKTFRVGTGPKKSDELCLNALRLLGYPYTLGRQYLATPGAPHAWPSVLSALDWLREEITNLTEDMFKYDDQQNPEQEPVGKVLHEIMLASPAEDIKKHRERIHRAFFGNITQEDVQRQLEYAEGLENQLKCLDSGDVEEEELTRKISEQELHLDRLSQNLRTFETRLQVIQQQCEQRATQLDNLSKLKVEQERDLAAIQDKVKKQELAGYGRLVQKHNMLQERYVARSSARSDLSKEVEQLELDYSRREGEIAPALDQYNRKIGIYRGPSGQNLPVKCDLQICTYHAGFDVATEIPAVVDGVSNWLVNLRSAVATIEQQLTELDTQVLQRKETKERLDLAPLMAKITKLTDEVKRIDQLLQEEDELQREAERQLTDEHRDLSNQLQDLRESVNTEQTRLTELETHLISETKENIKIEKFLKELERKMKIVTTRLESRCEQLQSATQMRKAQTEALCTQIRSGYKRIEEKINAVLPKQLDT